MVGSPASLARGKTARHAGAIEAKAPGQFAAVVDWPDTTKPAKAGRLSAHRLAGTRSFTCLLIGNIVGGAEIH